MVSVTPYYVAMTLLKRALLFSLAFLCLAKSQDLSSNLDLSIFSHDVIPEVVPILETLQGPVYRLELNLSDDLLNVEGNATVLVTNTSQEVWSELVFRLYPNALGSEMLVNETLVNDVVVSPTLDVENTVLRAPVELSPQEQVRVSFVYTLSLSNQPLGYGRLAKFDKVLSLAHAYPALSVYQDGAWLTTYPPELGDPLVAETSLFDVTIEAPESWQLITTGQSIEINTAANRQNVRVVTGPVRDFYLAATLDYNELSQQVGETTVRVFAPEKFTQTASSALETTAQALTVFSELYTPYPYREFDIVAIPVEAGGIEHPGVIIVTSSLFANPFGTFTSVLVHEIAHQWSFNLVGSDQINHPWLDESLTQYLSWRFQREVNPGFVTGLENYWRNLWNRSPDMPIGLPVSAYDEASYGGIVYGKGLFFFTTLAEELGQGEFDNALRAYFETYAWRIVTPSEFEGSVERSCMCELSNLFDEWVR
jgi:hypothetical protein